MSAAGAGHIHAFGRGCSFSKSAGSACEKLIPLLLRCPPSFFGYRPDMGFASCFEFYREVGLAKLNITQKSNADKIEVYEKRLDHHGFLIFGES